MDHVYKFSHLSLLIPTVVGGMLMQDTRFAALQHIQWLLYAKPKMVGWHNHSAPLALVSAYVFSFFLFIYGI